MMIDVRSEDHVTAALALARLGFMVFPLRPIIRHPNGEIGCGCGGKPKCPGPGKHPNVYWRTPPWPTRNRKVIRDWWSRHPLCGIGIALDRRTILLDLDVKHDAL